MSRRIGVSVVSHGHGVLMRSLLEDLARVNDGRLEVIATLNVPDPALAATLEGREPLRVVSNERPVGFGANQNRAFALTSAPYFCVANPDIRLDGDPFGALVDACERPGVGVAAPLVVNAEGEVEDSARRFPTPLSIVKKAFGQGWCPEYRIGAQPMAVDWVAGMFMVFPRAAFEEVGGFDERYHLYYEDVDICARLHAAGLKVVLVPSVRVIHSAQRRSHHNLKHLAWHVGSMARFFVSNARRQRRGSCLAGRRW